MFDTIKLKFQYSLPDNQFFVRLHGKDVWTNNGWRKEQEVKGIYAPKYYIEPDYTRPEIMWFYIEFSAPKILKGCSLFEIKENELELLAERISDFCRQIGILIFPQQIINSKPVLLAICKNINLTSLCSTNDALKVLGCFDFKSRTNHRLVDFCDCKHNGSELIFSVKEETLKTYDKTRELLNSAKTDQERVFADKLHKGALTINGELISQILRLELTLKTPRKILAKSKSYLGTNAPTLKNLFKQDYCNQLLRKQVDEIFNHPLQKIIYLSLEKQPVIDNFLDNHYSHIQTKATIRQLVSEIQEKGLAKTRRDYLDRYKSRQTWYNYLKRLIDLQKNFNWQELGKLDNAKIHRFFLEQFGITTPIQDELGLIFDTPVSKIKDTQRRNTDNSNLRR